ncbi:hypothetical protein BU24DRAFT_462948 [Aaosphaeria arxii CBS 175.79]|uniref:Uncharacterized protein n=1 Tax=Aaosphaeria arxii CBS 175.79 TaxID=1450172 RepID=A0A6A5XLJ6_9PLEO|nr:uncharacterized protein BU24DRAFT_462948 [Aaosphaeria arxii CBS 175.79]KAF2014135.1 hypothetical protein BU24DRAFT_462948 [Aaosphaeria arxii CBS 175.79]
MAGSFRSPLYLLGPPLLLLVSIPLAVFAVLTTLLAISTLAVRVSIVYFELGVALFHAFFFPPPPKIPSKQPSPSRLSPNRTRHRRSSIASTASSLETAVPTSNTPRLHNKSGSFASLIGTGEITRDFEGVGGWRVPGDEDEEALWMGINSRLELPAVVPKRKHQRSLTGGSLKFTRSPEAVRISPMHSRARTPIQTHGNEPNAVEGYFPPQTHMRPLSTTSDPMKVTQDSRRKSGSSSSDISLSRRASAVLKHVGE